MPRRWRRLHEALGGTPAEPRLADAQRAIAREHGHATWAAFSRELARQADVPGRAVGRIGPVGSERYDEAAATLLRMLAGGSEPARRRLRAYVPRLAGLADGALAERASTADARLVVAREHGFPSWRALVEGLRRESEAWHRARRPPESVAAALAAIRAGDAPALRRLLDADPGLVHAEVGAGGSLLGEVAQPDVFGSPLRHALGVDRACVELLIERGSDLDGPLNLAACFDRVELVELLLAAGARVDERETFGVTPLETAIYHASRTSVDMLSAVALVPDAPWVAAGAGRVDRLEQFLDGQGGLVADAYLHRPNPADVGWLHRLPARDVAQDVLDEALVHAAQNERPASRHLAARARRRPGGRSLSGLRCPASRRRLRRRRKRATARRGGRGHRAPERPQRRQRPRLGGVRARARAPRRSRSAAVRDLLRSLGSRPAVWGRPPG